MSIIAKPLDIFIEKFILVEQPVFFGNILTHFIVYSVYRNGAAYGGKTKTNLLALR